MPFDKLLHGGDYNPEQWLTTGPDILAQRRGTDGKRHTSIRSDAGVCSPGPPSEPQEGEYSSLDWLADIIHNLYARRNLHDPRPRPARPARPGWHAYTP